MKLAGALPGEPEAAGFVEALRLTLEGHRAMGITFAFQDFDISRNRGLAGSLPFWKELFRVFRSTGVLVRRFRAYRTPLDDGVAALTAGWLGTCSAGSIPWELHLSGCRLTTVGWDALCDAVAGNAAFPRDTLEGKIPTFCRSSTTTTSPHRRSRRASVTG